jgi:hypothetical protein
MTAHDLPDPSTSASADSGSAKSANAVTESEYEIITPDVTKVTGTLDKDGFARVEGFSAGECKVSFPKLDKEAWGKLSVNTDKYR